MTEVDRYELSRRGTQAETTATKPKPRSDSDRDR